MTLEIDPPPSRVASPQRGHAAALRPGASGGTPVDAAPIVVALVNNMPYSALERTEYQFRSLLAAAAGRRAVRLRLAALPEVPRGPEARQRLAEHYWGIADLMAAPPDALIVTGTEPQAPSLRDEPYWARLVELLEFAEAQTISSVWSCLVAHAAVLELDGIERRRLSDKRVGVFLHAARADHWLCEGLSAPYPVPHSRWNDLPIDSLKAAGYTVVSESQESRADAFVRHGRSQLVFLQGHPEYEGRALLKEYSHDVARFVSGRQLRQPTLPTGYFDAAAVALLTAYEPDVLAGRLADPLAAFPFHAVAATLAHRWSGDAARLYANWLGYIAAYKLSGRVSRGAGRHDARERQRALR